MIRTGEQPDCVICGQPGSGLYAGLEDRLFGCPGLWNLKICSADDCGAVWLDPLPVADDIWKAYRTYYTHGKQAGKAGAKGARYRLRRLYKSILMRLQPVRRAREDVKYMYLRDVTPGRLLEVGCGSGRALARFKALGWTVEGQEVDSTAARGVLKKLDVPVHVGPLESLALDEASYDAVVLNHVIEHVLDPAALLASCHRLLKPGGILMLVTPNVESIGHSMFRAHWLALDPPRHVCLFTQRALMKAAGKAGFSDVEAWTTPANAETVAIGSLDIATSGTHDLDARPVHGKVLAAVFFQLWASAVYRYLPDSGEECVLRARKQPD